jgi:fucose permease
MKFTTVPGKHMAQLLIPQRTIGKPQRVSTRLIFLLCGIGQSAWAPLVPFAKARVHVNDQQFGLLLLCFGAGSMVSMPAIGMLASRFGCKRLIQITALGLCASLYALSVAPTPLTLAVTLIFFGASIGALDVAMNVQALLVASAGDRNRMSGFHAMYSVGGMGGAVLVSALIWLGAAVPAAAMLVVLVLIGLLLAAGSSLLPFGDDHAQPHTGFAWPHKSVWLLGIVAFLFMLAEGSMLDWSAIFLVDKVGIAAKQAGMGYAAFSVAMTASRFSGDTLIARLGKARVILVGALLAASGFILAIALPRPATAMFAFVLIGLGAANLVPLLFTLASEAKGVLGTNVSFVTTLGYGGILVGPALIGFVVHGAGFTVAFGGIGVLLLFAATVSRLVINTGTNTRASAAAQLAESKLTEL